MAGGGLESRPELAAAGRLAGRLVSRAVALAAVTRPAGSPLRRAVLAHPGPQAAGRPVVTASWPAAGRAGRGHPSVCQLRRLPDRGARGAVRAAAPRPGDDPDEPVRVQVAGASPARAGRLLSDMRRLAAEHNVYRGQVIAFGAEACAAAANGPMFLDRPRISRPEVVLPRACSTASNGRSPGSPGTPRRCRPAGSTLSGAFCCMARGTGKTHTVRYLLSQLPGSTAVVLSGGSLRAIGGGLRDRPGAAAIGGRGRGCGAAGRAGRGGARAPGAGPAAARDGRPQPGRQRDVPAHRGPGGRAGGGARGPPGPDRPHGAAAAAGRGRPAPPAPAFTRAGWRSAGPPRWPRWSAPTGSPRRSSGNCSAGPRCTRPCTRAVRGPPRTPPPAGPAAGGPAAGGPAAGGPAAGGPVAGGPAPGAPLRVTTRHLNRALDELLDSSQDLTRVLLGSRPARGADVIIRPVLPQLRPPRYRPPADPARNLNRDHDLGGNRSPPMS